MENQLKVTAYHEAGHAVACWRFGWPISRVSIVLKDAYLGAVTADDPTLNIRPDMDGSKGAKQAMRESIVVCCAGPRAQVRYDASSWHDGHGEKDFKVAGGLALRLGGISERANALGEKLDAEAQALVESHWAEIEAVATALLEHKELDGDVIKELLEALTGETIPASKLFSYASLA